MTNNKGALAGLLYGLAVTAVFGIILFFQVQLATPWTSAAFVLFLAISLAKLFLQSYRIGLGNKIGRAILFSLFYVFVPVGTLILVLSLQEVVNAFEMFYIEGMAVVFWVAIFPFMALGVVALSSLFAYFGKLDASRGTTRFFKIFIVPVIIFVFAGLGFYVVDSWTDLNYISESKQEKMEKQRAEENIWEALFDGEVLLQDYHNCGALDLGWEKCITLAAMLSQNESYCDTGYPEVTAICNYLVGEIKKGTFDETSCEKQWPLDPSNRSRESYFCQVYSDAYLRGK